MRKNRQLEIIPRHDSLQTLGIAMEHHPQYINKNIEGVHSLDIILLSFIITGDVIHHLDNETYPESNLSLSIINYGQQHTITTTDTGAEIMNIFLNLKHDILPRLPEALREALPLFLPVHISMQNKLNRMTRLHFTEEDQIVPLLKEMQKELQRASLGYEVAVKDYLRLFLIKCARKVIKRDIKPAADLNSHSLKRLERLRQFIDQNYKTQFQISDLARMSSFSPNYLCRIFKTYTGKTLTQYINERRIQAAMLLLQTTSKQVIEIANLAGFNDLSHFNHLFKRITGTSPRQFRR